MKRKLEVEVKAESGDILLRLKNKQTQASLLGLKGQADSGIVCLD
jgi:hypothetical protein